MTELTIGKNYGGVFGLDEKKGQQLIYNGGDNWIARQGDKEMIKDSQDTTTKVLEYINGPTIMMGKF